MANNNSALPNSALKKPNSAKTTKKARFASSPVDANRALKNQRLASRSQQLFESRIEETLQAQLSTTSSVELLRFPKVGNLPFSSTILLQRSLLIF